MRESKFIETEIGMIPEDREVRPEYKYNFGSFIKFNRAEKPVLKWFKDGEEI